MVPAWIQSLSCVLGSWEGKPTGLAPTNGRDQKGLSALTVQKFEVICRLQTDLTRVIFNSKAREPVRELLPDFPFWLSAISKGLARCHGCHIMPHTLHSQDFGESPKVNLSDFAGFYWP